MNGGIIVFWVIYALVAAALALALSWRDKQSRRPMSRLGRSVWLCSQCHALYAQPLQHCPQGHQVIEASAWRPELSKEDDDALPGRRVAAKPTICQ